jgi:hypothetical protein
MVGWWTVGGIARRCWPINTTALCTCVTEFKILRLPAMIQSMQFCASTIKTFEINEHHHKREQPTNLCEIFFHLFSLLVHSS